VTSSPGGSGSPTGVNSDVESRPYLDDDFIRERIIDVDLLPFVLPPYGVDYNEWLATHSLYCTTVSSARHLCWNWVFGVWLGQVRSGHGSV